MARADMSESELLTWQDRLNTCLAITEEMQGDLKKCSLLAGSTARVILERTLRFSAETIRSINNQFVSQRGPQAAILARSLFEQAARVAWAAHMEDGWERSLAYWAAEDCKIDRALKRYPEFIKLANRRLEQAAEVLSSGHKPAPQSMKDLVQEIHESGDTASSGEAVTRNATYVYYCIYRVLCRASHAHITTIGLVSPQAFLRHVIPCVVYSTFWVAVAVKKTCSIDVKGLEERFAPLLKGSADLEF